MGSAGILNSADKGLKTLMKMKVNLRRMKLSLKMILLKMTLRLILIVLKLACR